MIKQRSRVNVFLSSFRPSTQVSRHPFLYFGLPFISSIVLGSFILSSFTQTKVDYNSRNNRKLTKEERLLEEKKLKRTIDIREEYFKLTSKLNLEDYDMVPVPRLPENAIPPSPGEMESLLIKATEATLEPPSKPPFRHQYA